MTCSGVPVPVRGIPWCTRTRCAVGDSGEQCPGEHGVAVLGLHRCTARVSALPGTNRMSAPVCLPALCRLCGACSCVCLHLSVCVHECSAVAWWMLHALEWPYCGHGSCFRLASPRAGACRPTALQGGNVCRTWAQQTAAGGCCGDAAVHHLLGTSCALAGHLGAHPAAAHAPRQLIRFAETFVLTQAMHTPAARGLSSACSRLP
jgi:hypothetical protein